MGYSNKHDEQQLDDDRLVNPVTDGEDLSDDDGDQDEEPSHVHIQRPSAV